MVACAVTRPFRSSHPQGRFTTGLLLSPRRHRMWLSHKENFFIVDSLAGDAAREERRRAIAFLCHLESLKEEDD